LGRKRSCSGKQTYPGRPITVLREGAGKAGTSGDARPTNAGWASDEPVVVMNPVPMNAGNSWEGKTQGTLTLL